MNHDETFDTICVILEESREQGVEHAADLIMNALDHMGQDILDHLEPPVGLQRWLQAHGFALVATREVTPPRVWESIDQEAEEEEDLEDQRGGEPVLQVGDYVEYRTTPSGPRGQAYVGSGRVNAITSEGWVIIQDSPTSERWVNPQEGDLIRLARAPERSAEAQPS